jgi:hypothetical protein
LRLADSFTKGTTALGAPIELELSEDTDPVDPEGLVSEPNPDDEVELE